MCATAGTITPYPFLLTPCEGDIVQQGHLFATDPAQFHIANQGVAKVRLPPAKDDMATLRGELQTFVCDG